MTATAPLAVDGAPGAERASLHSWYLLFVLMVLYIVSSIDRQVLTLLVEPIKADLKLSDTQMSYLLGASFALFYGAMGVPAGYLVDRINRKKLIMGSVTFWSLCTALSALSRSFGQLFAGRAGVGMGEATLTPSAFSLVRDSFPESTRGRAFSLYMVGAAIGGGLSLAIVGWVLGAASSGAFDHLPFVGEMRVWQMVLFIIGLGGLPSVLLIALMREPVRRNQATRSSAGSTEDSPTFRAAFRHVRERSEVYVPNLMGYALGGLVGFGANAWLPTAIGRNWSISPQDVGVFKGTVTLIAMPIATLAWGFLTDRLSRGGVTARLPLIVGAAEIASALIAALITQVADLSLAWTCLALYLVLGAGSSTMKAVVVAKIAPGRMMGKITAMNYFVAVLVGAGLGPTVLAVVSDNFFTGPRAIGNALTIGFVVLGTANGLSCMLMARGLKRERERSAALAAPSDAV